MKPRTVVLWAGTLLLLSLLAALLGSAPPSQAGSDSWTTETSVSPSNDNYLLGVAAPDTKGKRPPAAR